MKSSLKHPALAILLLIFCTEARAQAPSISYNPSTISLPKNVAISSPITPVNAGGTVPAATYGQVATFAGSTSGLHGTTDNTGTNARFYGPSSGVMDAGGNLYITDSKNNSVRKITSAGAVTTLATGFSTPKGIAIDAAGTLYVSEYTGNSVKKVDATTGAVTTWVSGASLLTGPAGICFDGSGNLIVADQDANQIKMITPAGTISVYAGAGGNGHLTNSTNKLSAKFSAPMDVQVDAAGNIFVADFGNNALREISSAGVTTFLTGGGLGGPSGIAMDAAGNFYVTDYNNNEIWLVTASGTATVVAGGSQGSTDGAGTTAKFYNPAGLCFDSAGAAYIEDYGNNSIRKLNLTGYTISPSTLITGLTFDATTGGISGTPTVATAITAYTVTAYNASGSSNTVLNLGCGQTVNWIGSGGNGTKWERGSNWSTGSVPTTADDVYIGVNTSYSSQPTISSTTGNVTVNSISFGNKTTPTLTITGQSLTLNSALTLNASSTATVSGSGSLVMAPRSEVTVNGTTLTISTSAFTLQSDATGSAAVGPVTATSFITSNTTVNVERYIPGGSVSQRSYMLLSSPVSVTSTAAKGKIYSINYLKNNTFLTGTDAVAGGFDNTGGGANNPTLYLFRENFSGAYGSFTSTNFRGIKNIAQTPAYNYLIDVDGGPYNIPIGNGFLFFFRGSRSTATPFTPGTVPLSSTVSTSGTLNVGQVTVQLWFTPAGSQYLSYTPSTIYPGYTLVGNPYPSAIDWDTYTTTNNGTGIYGAGLTGAIWVLDPISKNYGAYLGGIGSASFVSNVIASGQGFFVQANAASPQLIFNESAKTTSQVTGSQLLMSRKSSMQAAKAEPQYLRLRFEKDAIINEQAVIRLVKKNSLGDTAQMNAPHISGSALASLSSLSGDSKNLSINTISFPSKKEARIVPLDVKAYSSGTYKLMLNSVVAIPELYAIWLIDAYKKDTVNLRKVGAYSVDINKSDSASFGSKRFSIVIRQDSTFAYRLQNFAAQKLPEGNKVQLRWETANEANYTNFTVERSTDGGETYAVLGGVPATGAGSYGLVDKSPAVGTNLYRLKQEDLNNAISYSKIVPIQYAKLSNGLASNLSIYPNPVSNGINVAITSPNTAAGAYQIRFVNSSGQLMKEATTSQPSWQGTTENLRPGTYIIQVFDNRTQKLVGENKFVKL